MSIFNFLIQAWKWQHCQDQKIHNQNNTDTEASEDENGKIRHCLPDRIEGGKVSAIWRSMTRALIGPCRISPPCIHQHITIIGLSERRPRMGKHGVFSTTILGHYTCSRGGSSLYSTRPARLVTKAKSGPGSTRPARDLKMPWLNWLDTSLFLTQNWKIFWDKWENLHNRWFLVDINMVEKSKLIFVEITMVPK